MKSTSKFTRRGLRRLFKKSQKRIVRYSILTANLALLTGVVLFVVQNPNASTAAKQNALADNNAAANPLDQLSSAEIAVHVARMASMEETTAVVNEADTVNAQLSISPADDKVIAKPLVADTAIKTKKDIKKYTVAAGDSLASIAAKFGVSSDSIRWSNGLTGTTAPVGRELLIPPVSNGIVYAVKPGDTPETLAQRFNANKDQIIVFNDAETTGLKQNELIVIPDGSILAVAPVYTGGSAAARTSVSTANFGAVYGGNGYAAGYCTWWAAHRRAQIGRPIPNNLGNAVTWKVLSQRAGLGGGSVPKAGSVIWFPMGGYGHVGFVESVSEDGSVNISDMNWGGWNRVSYRTIPASEAGRYYYIY